MDLWCRYLARLNDISQDRHWQYFQLGWTTRKIFIADLEGRSETRSFCFRLPHLVANLLIFLTALSHSVACNCSPSSWALLLLCYLLHYVCLLCGAGYQLPQKVKTVRTNTGSDWSLQAYSHVLASSLVRVLLYLSSLSNLFQVQASDRTRAAVLPMPKVDSGHKFVNYHHGHFQSRL